MNLTAIEKAGKPHFSPGRALPLQTWLVEFAGVLSAWCAENTRIY
jgi:hypothetical protein